MGKMVISGLAMACISVLAVLIHVKSNESHGRSRSLTEVRLSQVVFAAGRIEGRAPEVELRPEVHTRIVEILVTEGQTISVGQALLRLDNRTYYHHVMLAQSGLEMAQAQLEQLQNGARTHERTEADAQYRARLARLERAQIELRRITELRQANAISEQDYDDSRMLVVSLEAETAAAKSRADLISAPARADEVRLARSRIGAARAQLNLAQVQLERCEIKSPMDGQVLQVNAEVGELVGPDSAQPVFIIADTSRFRVRAFVEEQDAPRVKVGMPSTIRMDARPNHDYVGRVSDVAPRMGNKSIYSDDPGERLDTKTREVWIDLEVSEHLIVGLRVDVTINCESDQSINSEPIATKQQPAPGPVTVQAPSLINPQLDARGASHEL